MSTSFDVNKDSYLKLGDINTLQGYQQSPTPKPLELPCLINQEETDFRAAGLLPYINVGDDIYILLGLERRSDQSLCLGVCGGRRDKSDLGSLHTAIREFEEETGYILQNFLGRDTIWRYPYQEYPTGEVPGLITTENSEKAMQNLPPVTSDISMYIPWAKYCVHMQSCGDVEFPSSNEAFQQLYMNKQLSDGALELSLLWKWANSLLLGGLSNYLYYNLPAHYIISQSYRHYQVKQTFNLISTYLIKTQQNVLLDKPDTSGAVDLTKVNDAKNNNNNDNNDNKNQPKLNKKQKKKLEEEERNKSLQEEQRQGESTTDSTTTTPTTTTTTTTMSDEPTTYDTAPLSPPPGLPDVYDTSQQTYQQEDQQASEQDQQEDTTTQQESTKQPQEQPQEQPKGRKQLGPKPEPLRLPLDNSIGQARLAYPQFPYTHMALEHCLPPQFPLPVNQREVLEKDMENKLQQYNQHQAQRQMYIEQMMKQQKEMQEQQEMEQNGDGNEQMGQNDQNDDKISNFNPYMDEDDVIESNTNDDDNNNDNNNNVMDQYNQYLAYSSASRSSGTTSNENPTTTTQSSTSSTSFTPPQQVPQTSIRSLLCWLLPLAHHFNSHILPAYDLGHKRDLLDLKNHKYWVNEMIFKDLHPEKFDCSKQFWPNVLERGYNGQFLFKDQFPAECESEAKRLAHKELVYEAINKKNEEKKAQEVQNGEKAEENHENGENTEENQENQNPLLSLGDDNDANDSTPTTMSDDAAATSEPQLSKKGQKKAAKENKKENKKVKVELDLTKYFYVTPHPLISAYSSYNLLLSEEAVNLTKSLINFRALEEGLIPADAAKRRRPLKNNTAGHSTRKAHAASQKGKKGRIVAKSNKNTAESHDIDISTDPSTQDLINNYQAKSHVDNLVDINGFSLLVSTPTPEQKYSAFEASFNKELEDRPSSTDINNRFARKAKSLALYEPQEEQYKHPFLQRLYNQMVKQRFFSMKSKQLQEKRDQMMAKSVHDSTQDLIQTTQRLNSKNNDDNEDDTMMGDGEDQDPKDTMMDEDENQQQNDENGDQNDQNVTKTTLNPNSPSTCTYTVTDLYPKPNSKYYASDRSRLETEVGFDSMVSLHWVSVKSLFQSKAIPAHSPFAHFLQDAKYAPPPSADVHSPKESIVNEQQSSYGKVLKTFLRGKQTLSNHSAITSTGFMFPIGNVLAKVCGDYRFSSTMAHLLEQRYNMFNPQFQPQQYARFNINRNNGK